MEYYIGQIFKNTYPMDASTWCNNNNAYIDDIGIIDGVRQFEIKENGQLPPIDVDKLMMTPLDFIKELETLGLTIRQINDFLDENIEIKTQLMYCNNVYCGVAKSFVPVKIGNITITKDIIEQIFKNRNGVI